MIISENDYMKYMKGEVEPLLDSRVTVRYLNRGNGQNIYWEFYDCKNAKGILLISHGFTETAEKFKEVIWMFLSAGYHVCIIDHCGHGRSYRLTDDPCLVHVDRYERYAEDLSRAAHAACEYRTDLPLYLWAHSMGGGIGAALAASEPDLFNKVILTSPMIRPLISGIPWGAAKAATNRICNMGKEQSYAAGQHPYRDDETFRDSAAMSRPRFDYYNEKRRREPMFQMSGASYGWLRETGRLNEYLMKKGYKTLKCPALLFQADVEHFVSNDEQKSFVKKVNSSGGDIRLITVPGSKHEIYSSEDKILEKYWDEILTFLFIR